MYLCFCRYVIEKKEKLGTRWVKSGKTSGPELKYRVTDVDEGTEIQFQVRAENEAGVGHPSEPTEFMTIEDPTSMSQYCINATIIIQQSYNDTEKHMLYFTNALFCFRSTITSN